MPVKINKKKFKRRVAEWESILDVFERAKKFVKYLKETYNNENILIVGHKNFLMCLEIVLTGKDIMHYYSFKSLENAEIREFHL
ncbi:MAG: histidine phosphatase family protein [Nanoarchaeota archaeon]